MTSRLASVAVLAGVSLVVVGGLTAAGVSPVATTPTTPAERALALREGIEFGLAGFLSFVGGVVFLVDDRLRVGLDTVQRRLFAAGALLAVVGAALALADVVAAGDWVGALLVALAFETGATLWGVVRQVRRATRVAEERESLVERGSDHETLTSDDER